MHTWKFVHKLLQRFEGSTTPAGSRCHSTVAEVGLLGSILQCIDFHFLRQDVTTRWNSTYLMFERFVVLKPALVYMQGRQEFKDHHKVLSKIKERDWGLMANVVNVLKIFYEITLQLSHASACISEASYTWGKNCFETDTLTTYIQSQRACL